jgi:hypothetical protein
MALLTEESWKLTFGGSLIVSTHHQVYSSAKSRKVADWLQNIKIWSHPTEKGWLGPHHWKLFKPSRISAGRESPDIAIWILLNTRLKSDSISVIQVKGAGSHWTRNKNADLWTTPCAFCAHVPENPSAEVNFVLARQFSISLSSIVTPVVLFLTVLTVGFWYTPYSVLRLSSPITNLLRGCLFVLFNPEIIRLYWICPTFIALSAMIMFSFCIPLK